MLFRRLLLLALILMIPLALTAQDYATPESPSRQGISTILGAGARALGMGGAFTAVADDATAASWNPAGLAQLTKPEASFVFDHFSGSIDTEWLYTRTYDEGFMFEGTQQFQEGSLTYNGVSFLSATYPFSIKEHPFVTQISFHRLSTFPAFRSTWLERWSLLDTDNILYTTEVYDYKTTADYTGGINATTLSLATELGSGFRLGISLNYMDADITNKNYSSYRATYQGYYSGDVYLWDFWRKDSFQYTFSDLNFDFGLHWKLSDFVTVGAVYHSAFETDLDYSSTSELFDSSINYLYSPVRDNGKSQISWPDGYAVGIAIHPTNLFTIALDYSVTNWSEAKLDSISAAGFYYDSSTGLWVPAIFSGEDVPYPYFSYSQQEDTSSWRIGMEYVYILGKAAIPFRLGFFREDQIVNYWDAGEIPTYDGITMGTGITYNRVQFDIAWVHTTGDEKGYYGETFAGVLDEQVSSTSISNDRVLASLIVRFD
ncbi:MAG TPA: hypothetical protein PK014_02270 [Thermoanaerobaculia bacterium]|nr:hypothetical protein [Thermoanaerobaculia bacterium]HUM28941.1 hypothetical protein [Thermoanaerobaculia bacterium]HXK67127.1 hypothetical protein [Thermoanaerobaculia bacterium]